MQPFADGHGGHRWKKSEGSQRRHRSKNDWKEKSNRKGCTSNQWIIFVHFLVILRPLNALYSPQPHGLRQHQKRIQFHKYACYSIVNARVTRAPRHCPLRSVHRITVAIATAEEGNQLPTGHNWYDCSVLQCYAFKRIPFTGSGRPSAHYWMMSSEKVTRGVSGNGSRLQTSSITAMSTSTLIQECCLTLTFPLFSLMTGSGQERKRLIDPSQAVI